MKITQILPLAAASLSLVGCAYSDPATRTPEQTAVNDANVRRMAKQYQANTKATARSAAAYQAPSE